APYRIYNIGNHSPIQLMDFIENIEIALGIEAKKNFLPMQDGDVLATCADIQELKTDVGYEPKVKLQQGLKHWIAWYKKYNRK
ncbi:protein CapI, partial [Cutibacterium acnes]